MKMKLAYLCILLFIVLAATACANTGENSKAAKEEMSTAAESSSTTISEPIDSTTPDENISRTTDDASENIPDRQYSVGNIILSGGSAVTASGLTSLNSDDPPVAVVAGVKDNGTSFAVGVYRSSESLQWKSDETDNSPAFDFISGYAEGHGLTGEMASGWYMPSIEELRTLYENRDAVNNALEKIYQLDNNAAVNGLSTTWYWSSTQSESHEDYAWFVHFYNGYAGECPKNFTNVNVIAVREL